MPRLALLADSDIHPSLRDESVAGDTDGLVAEAGLAGKWTGSRMDGVALGVIGIAWIYPPP